MFGAQTYLVITGAGIKDVTIKKKAMVMPFQRVTKISVTPFDFGMNLQAMTKEKLKFSLPAVFTIGPKEDDMRSMRRYATLLTGESDGAPSKTAGAKVVSTGRNHVQDIVKGIIEGETRSIVSNMTIEEVFASRAEYKKQVIEKVQGELDQFGLMIYNANVKELEDTPGSEYFAFMRRKAHESASNQARIDVAHAEANGKIGEAERTSRAKQEIAKIDATTAIEETKRKTEKADADFRLERNRIEIDKNLSLERIQAGRVAETRDAELVKDLEIKRADMEIERRRAQDVVRAKIQRESAAQAAEAEKFKQQTDADAKTYSARAAAEAEFAKQQKRTEAEAFTVVERAKAQREAAENEAHALYAQRAAEARGISEMAKAYGELGRVLGGPQGLMQYLMLKDGLYEKLAASNAQAVNNLQPKINVWNTGSNTEGSGASGAIRDIFQNLPPLMDTIHQQTGMTPPNWLMQMPQQQQQEQKEKENNSKELQKRGKMPNGV